MGPELEFNPYTVVLGNIFVESRLIRCGGGLQKGREEGEVFGRIQLMFPVTVTWL